MKIFSIYFYVYIKRIGYLCKSKFLAKWQKTGDIFYN